MLVPSLLRDDRCTSVLTSLQNHCTPTLIRVFITLFFTLVIYLIDFSFFVLLFIVNDKGVVLACEDPDAYDHNHCAAEQTDYFKPCVELLLIED